MNPRHTLNMLRVGQSALVEVIEAEPAMRRRLLDPAAYLIRGAVIALRGKDAAGIQVGGLREQELVRRPALA